MSRMSYLSACAVALALATPAAAMPADAGGVEGLHGAAATPTATTAVHDVPVAGASMAEYEELYGALVQAGYADSRGTVRFTHEGSALVLPSPESVQRDRSKGVGSSLKGGPQEIGGGITWRGPYVSFNRTDQSALIAGSLAALSAAICAIPAVGQIACGSALTIIAIAGVYLNANGRCPTSRPYLRYYFANSKKFECVR